MNLYFLMDSFATIICFIMLFRFSKFCAFQIDLSDQSEQHSEKPAFASRKNYKTLGYSALPTTPSDTGKPPCSTIKPKTFGTSNNSYGTKAFAAPKCTSRLNAPCLNQPKTTPSLSKSPVTPQNCNHCWKQDSTTSAKKIT